MSAAEPIVQITRRRARLVRVARRLRYAFNRWWLQTKNIADVVDIAFVLGLLSLGYGIYLYSPRLSFIIVGALILLSLRPLIYWIKR